MEVKKGNTYFQDRCKERLEPILLEVLRVILGTAEVYKNAKRRVVYRMEKLKLNEQK